MSGETTLHVHAGSSPAVCPFIGLDSDSGSLTAYPSSHNLCQNCRPPVSPSFSHQEQFCLTRHHEQCGAYTTGVLPLDARPVEDTRTARSIPWGRVGLFSTGLVMLGVLAFFTNAFIQSLFSSSPVVLTEPATSAPAANTDEPTEAPQASSTASVPTVTLTVAPQVTETASPEPTAPPTQTDEPVSRALYQPIGPPGGPQFVIHRIVNGDNLDILLRQYGTSLDAVQAVNQRVPVPIWIDYLLIFPYQTTDVTGQPVMRALEVTNAAEISLADLAAQLGVDAALLGQLNNCATGCTLQRGDWLLVPVQP